MRYISGNIILSSRRYGHYNIIKNNRTFFTLDYLSPSHKKSKGGNSSVFKLIDPNNQTEYAIKFLKFPSNSSHPFNIKQNIRFDDEINALKEAKDKGFENVVEFLFDGTKKIGENIFKYYVMEKADSDLSSFLSNNTIPENQKLVLCYEISNGITQLHSMDIYHRDIKPDNIFIVTKNGKNIWKIGDLGLSVKRGKDLSKIEFREKIGPYGWLSPEVTNKVLCEGTTKSKLFDCVIDEKSDIFQMGKLFWFVFQGNIPVGQIRYSDFLVKNRDVYSLITNMLQYKKTRRKELSYFTSCLSELTSQ
jgi:serine/threonine protein kinase